MNDLSEKMQIVFLKWGIKSSLRLGLSRYGIAAQRPWTCQFRDRKASLTLELREGSNVNIQITILRGIWPRQIRAKTPSLVQAKPQAAFTDSLGWRCQRWPSGQRAARPCPSPTRPTSGASGRISVPLAMDALQNQSATVPRRRVPPQLSRGILWSEATRQASKPKARLNIRMILENLVDLVGTGGGSPGLQLAPARLFEGFRAARPRARSVEKARDSQSWRAFSRSRPCDAV